MTELRKSDASDSENIVLTRSEVIELLRQEIMRRDDPVPLLALVTLLDCEEKVPA